MSEFKDRNDAARQLADKLSEYKGRDGVVLAVPRGGIPIGYILALELHFPLDVIFSKKIGHPLHPEYAIGSVTLHGVVTVEKMQGISTSYIRSEAKKILENLERKHKLYTGGHRPVNLKSKTVIITDDGIATGSTIKATVLSVRKEKPAEIIIAVPVASPDAARRMAEIADRFVCLMTPEGFRGVGQFYNDFSQVSDEEAISLLKQAHKKAA